MNPFRPKATRFCFLFIFYFSFFISVQAQSPYALKTGRELAIFGAGAATGITALVLEKQVTPLTVAQINSLNRNDIPAFDRPATYRFSHTYDRLSDVTWASGVAGLGLLTLGTKPMRQDWKTVGVMYIETVLLANGVQRSVKNIVQRTRPFAYNPDAPLAEKLDREARQSFPSGHATNAFATAVFTSEVFRHYFPQSKWKPVVWVGSLGLATTTAVLRYTGGQHYPTDLLAGATIGSLLGWGIPKLHEVKNRSDLGQRLDVQPWSNGQASGIYLQLAVFSR
ncbi:phosphatase PAP2 family protein [Spirosoma montaniterrae]|uniref:Phosphoesterase PA-phosphatase n=1 Tax=Spirosoma montaniterrae TaxID=1178516 RepID=A0A1P9WVD7_9BACT|nr:phosphatase PAP2 family protein [Spirosoma montaniterrae]AQG79329.1 phosphoesterase PA-phosphatase [Spirosoma montaniterrae]